VAFEKVSLTAKHPKVCAPYGSQTQGTQRQIIDINLLYLLCG